MQGPLTAGRGCVGQHWESMQTRWSGKVRPEMEFERSWSFVSEQSYFVPVDMDGQLFCATCGTVGKYGLWVGKCGWENAGTISMGGRSPLGRCLHIPVTWCNIPQLWCTYSRTVELYMALGSLWVSGIVWKHCLGVDIALVSMVTHHGALPTQAR